MMQYLYQDVFISSFLYVYLKTLGLHYLAKNTQKAQNQNNRRKLQHLIAKSNFCALIVTGKLAWQEL